MTALCRFLQKFLYSLEVLLLAYTTADIGFKHVQNRSWKSGWHIVNPPINYYNEER